MKHPRILACLVAVALLAAVPAVPALATQDLPESAAPAQRALEQLGLYRGPITGQYDQATGDAILALHKAAGTDRTREWAADDWLNVQALTSIGFSIPDRPGEPNRLEIDLYRQLMFLVEDHEVVAVFPIVSGRGDTYQTLGRASGGSHTPVGDFTILRHIDGWRHAALGRIYRPWYFIGGYAIHGGRVAHPQPASHGCVRVPMYDMDWLEGHLELGMPVHVWVGEDPVAVSAYRLERALAGESYSLA